MTRSDAWRKRPCVERYRAWCDEARLAAGQIPENVIAVHCYAHIKVPESWSQKKKQAHYGKLHRQRPDEDNILKACKDALFSDDSAVSIGQCVKLWCEEGEPERVDVFLLAL